MILCCYIIMSYRYCSVCNLITITLYVYVLYIHICHVSHDVSIWLSTQYVTIHTLYTHICYCCGNINFFVGPLLIRPFIGAPIGRQPSSLVLETSPRRVRQSVQGPQQEPHIQALGAQPPSGEIPLTPGPVRSKVNTR